MFKKLLLTFIFSATVGIGLCEAVPTAKDTVRFYTGRSELSDITCIRKATSAVPVSITVKGCYLSVVSPRTQMLPVYSFTGTYYCAFKLNKGTNTINGLPRGTYVINNHKYTIS